ncbi:hypothetical protein AVEN_94351-1 [Araneus ventricosus]|uniref:Uncharacterized protein n=1 Tax=Araneus ventricosus TaxID=182803 RepID=A0A4Y2EC74_ARAVE|nr:hypothetical protein AVEN_94351-1 [Araneus ventricosus]
MRKCTHYWNEDNRKIESCEILTKHLGHDARPVAAAKIPPLWRRKMAPMGKPTPPLRGYNQPSVMGPKRHTITVVSHREARLYLLIWQVLIPIFEEPP